VLAKTKAGPAMTGGVEKNRVEPFVNSILTFKCYTSSRRRKKDRVKRIQGMRSIDKDCGENI
jgi:hypothetical protein